MKSSLLILIAALISIAPLYSGTVQAANIVWNEVSDGDLSSSPASPTAVTFSTGGNTVIGSVSEPDGDLRDYLTFTLGPNQYLTSLILDAASPGGISFHALNVGNTSFIPGVDPSSNFLGLEFVFDALVGMDVLPDLAAGGYGSTGFTIPLGPGTYSYLIQELTPGESRTYQLTFNVVPEPASSSFVLLSAGILTLRRRRM